MRSKGRFETMKGRVRKVSERVRKWWSGSSSECYARPARTNRNTS